MINLLVLVVKDIACIMLICVAVKSIFDSILKHPYFYLTGTVDEFAEKSVDERQHVFAEITKQLKENNREFFHQISLMSASSIICCAVMRIYVVIEDKFHLDAQHFSGAFLTLSLFLGGQLINLLYLKFFVADNCSDTDRLQIDAKEYLVIVILSFLSVSIKLVAEGAITIIMPLALVLGRLMWFDTKSYDDILASIQIDSKRIIKMNILQAIGMLFVSIGIWIWGTRIQIKVACIYAIMLIVIGAIMSNMLDKKHGSQKK